MKLSSSAFAPKTTIPIKYTQYGDNVNPPLDLDDMPSGTKSWVLIVEDPDIPPQAGTPPFDHWIVFNIPAEVTSIPENWTVQGVRGRRVRDGLDYLGPKPPDRQHRYFFKAYALDTDLLLGEGATKVEIENAMKGHILAQAELIGLFAPP